MAAQMPSSSVISLSSTEVIDLTPNTEEDVRLAQSGPSRQAASHLLKDTLKQAAAGSRVQVTDVRKESARGRR